MKMDEKQVAKVMRKMDSKTIGQRIDGWVNSLVGLGKLADKLRQSYYADFVLLDDDMLTRMYLGEGLGKKIIGTPADDMTRNWISIQGDDEGKIQTELMRLNAETEINQAIRWARLYRGAVIVVGAQGNGELKEPLSQTIKGIGWLKTYAATRIQNTTADIVKEPDSPYFEDFEIVRVMKLDGTILPVHRSRCLVFKGEPVPDNIKNLGWEYNYWGVSILQAVWDRLRNYSSIESGIANLMTEIIVGKYKIEGLMDLLSDGNTDAIYTRMEIINASKSIINSVLLGENEDYVRDTANIAGVAEIIDRFMMNLSSVCEIPVTRLFGRSPAGMNATGEADLRNYYDMITSKQKTWLRPPLQKLVNMIGVYMKVPKPVISFNPVWEPTQEELVKMRKMQAETDQIYIQNAVLDPEQVTESRFEGGYSFETSVETPGG